MGLSELWRRCGGCSICDDFAGFPLSKSFVTWLSKPHPATSWWIGCAARCNVDSVGIVLEGVLLLRVCVLHRCWTWYFAVWDRATSCSRHSIRAFAHYSRASKRRIPCSCSLQRA